MGPCLRSEACGVVKLGQEVANGAIGHKPSDKRDIWAIDTLFSLVSSINQPSRRFQNEEVSSTSLNGSSSLRVR